MQEREIRLALQERGPLEVGHARFHAASCVHGGERGQRGKAEVPPRVSQGRRPSFDFDARRIDLAEDLSSAPHPGLGQRIDADLPGPTEEPRVFRIDEPFAFEGLQRPRDVTAEEPRALRDARLRSFAARFPDVPERVEME